jgi:hypothetical protein
VQGKAKMKKLSESRLRQIVKEELEVEINDQNDIDIARRDIIKIIEKLKEIELDTDHEVYNDINEWIIPALGALGRGLAWGGGVAGITSLLRPDAISNAGETIQGIASGETELELSGSMYITLKKLLIAKILSVFKIDGMLNSFLTNSLAKRSADELWDLIINRECKTFVDFTWDAFVQWGIEIIKDPIANFSHKMVSAAPMLKNLIAPAYGDSLATMLFAGTGAQEIGRMFQENEDIVNFLENEVKPNVCKFVDENLANLSPSGVTGSILGMLSEAKK